MLSELRHGAERSQKIYEELGQAAQNPGIKEAPDARELVSSQIIKRLDECFRLIGEKLTKINQRLHEVFIEDFRRELNEIQGPIARKIFILAKASHLAHLQVAHRSNCSSRYAGTSRSRDALGKLPSRQTRLHGKNQTFDS
jgi:hypothetical protein